MTKAPEQTPNKLTRILFPVCVVLLLVFLCITQSQEHPFWMDEVLTFYPVTDPSFVHMLQACQRTINTVPPLYFILLWFWVRVAGDSVLMIRLFSTLCMAGAFGIMWRLALKRFGTFPAMLGTVAVFFSFLMIHESADSRFYPLYMLTAAWAIQTFDKILVTVKKRQAPASALDYALNFAAHSAMIFTHTFGLLYSGSLLVARMVVDLRDLLASNKSNGTEKRKFFIDYGFYGTIVLSWLFFAVVWAPTAVHQLAANRNTWIAVPTVKLLIQGILYQKRIPATAAILAIVGIVAKFASGRKVQHDAPAAPSNVPLSDPEAKNALARFGLLLASVAILVIPELMAFVVSHRGVSCFLPRYFVASELGWVLVVAYATWYAGVACQAWLQEKGTAEMRRTIRTIGPALAWCVTAVFLFKTLPPDCRRLLHAAPQKFPRPGADVEQVAQAAGIPEDTPIVIEDANNSKWADKFFYSKRPSRYLYPLDIDMDDTHNDARITVDMELKALVEEYPEVPVTDTRTLLAQDKPFLCLAPERWFKYRIASNPHYNVRVISADDSPIGSLVLVEPLSGQSLGK